MIFIAKNKIFAKLNIFKCFNVIVRFFNSQLANFTTMSSQTTAKEGIGTFILIIKNLCRIVLWMIDRPNDRTQFKIHIHILMFKSLLYNYIETPRFKNLEHVTLDHIKISKFQNEKRFYHVFVWTLFYQIIPRITRCILAKFQANSKVSIS